MKALLLVDNPDNKLAFRQMDRPTPEDGQVLLRVKAAALNRRDEWIRQGKYPGIRFDTILGSDGAGVVESVGGDISEDFIGKEVLINPNMNWGDNPAVQAGNYHIVGMPTNGTFAEFIVVHKDQLFEKPAHLSWEAAAALPLGGLTAFRAVFHHGHVSAGQNVLISGIGGGVAQFAFQFALAAGARVFVTSGQQEKLDKAVDMGAKAGFNYKTEGWQKAAIKQSGGFDCVIDSAGGDQLNDFVKMMKPAGRIVFYGATNGMPAKLDVFRMFWNQITLQGSTMGNDDEFAKMVKFVAEHKIEPLIDSVRPFDQIVSAFDAMRSGNQFGKLVVSMG
ncbi:MAG: zinc-binding dehydrogenase [Roseivirga sp.]|nr:zinc-binding dehydrogenase [Roseivirga sp.]